MCKVLKVSTSGYYKWLKIQNRTGASEAEQYKQELKQKVAKSFHESLGTYGSPRIFDDLVEWGYRVSQKTVARLMNELGISAKPKKRYVKTTDSSHNLRAYPDLIRRNFHTLEPNRIWVSDITYVRTLQGWLYLASLMDLFSRKIVGWNYGSQMTKELTVEALNNALITRKPREGLIHHSDQGVQYCCNDYTQMLNEKGILISMSRKGDPYDNACIESFHATIKKEFIYRRRFKTRDEAVKAIDDYIVFYNGQRKHSTLGNLSPEKFEKQSIIIRAET